MAGSKLVSRLSYETFFTVAEIERMLADAVRKNGIDAQFNSVYPHFKWAAPTGCMVSFIGEKEMPPPRAEHAAEGRSDAPL